MLPCVCFFLSHSIYSLYLTPLNLNNPQANKTSSVCITGLRLPPRDNRSTYIYINPENSHPLNKDLESESESDEEEAPLLPRHNQDSRPNACALQGVCVERNGKGGDEDYGSFYNGVRSSAKKQGDGYEADSDEEVVKDVK